MSQNLILQICGVSRERVLSRRRRVFYDTQRARKYNYSFSNQMIIFLERSEPAQGLSAGSQAEGNTAVGSLPKVHCESLGRIGGSAK